MPKPPTTDSGQAKIAVNITIDPALRDWARLHDINLSKLLAEAIVAKCGPVPSDRQRDRPKEVPAKDTPF